MSTLRFKRNVTGALFKGATWDEFLEKIDTYFLPFFRKPLLVTHTSSVLSQNFQKRFGSEDLMDFVAIVKEYPGCSVYVAVEGLKTRLPKEVAQVYIQRCTSLLPL